MILFYHKSLATIRLDIKKPTTKIGLKQKLLSFPISINITTYHALKRKLWRSALMLVKLHIEKQMNC